MGNGASARPASVVAEASKYEIRCWIDDMNVADIEKLKEAIEEREQATVFPAVGNDHFSKVKFSEADVSKVGTSQTGSTECSDGESLEPQESFIDPQSPCQPYSALQSFKSAANAARFATKVRRDLSLKDWGAPELPVVKSRNLQCSAPLLIIEPWEHVGYNELEEPVRASTNIAVLAERIGLDGACIPLWQEGTAYDVDKLEELLVGKTLVFEGGHPSVYDPSSFTCKCCPRSFIYSVYKRVLLMRHQTGPGVFVCLSHQIAIASLVELVKDAVQALLKSKDAITVGVAEEIQRVGRSIKIVKDGEDVVCVGYDHVDDQGCDQFATARNEQPEAALLKLYPFDPSDFEDRPDLAPCVDAHSKISESVPDDEIKLQMEEDSDGFFLAMFHSDEVNAEAVLFANWAFGQIATVHDRHPQHPPWLKRMPRAVEITACTKDEETGEMVTEVASMRIDYEVDGSRKSFYTCQFHPELDKRLRDSRMEVPNDGEDGERLIHSLLLDMHIAPDENGGYTPSTAFMYNPNPQQPSDTSEDAPNPESIDALRRAGSNISTSEIEDQRSSSKTKVSSSETDSEAEESPEPKPSKASALKSFKAAAGAARFGVKMQRELSLKDWGEADLPVIKANNIQSSAPLIIFEPWEHVGYNEMEEPVRASTNIAVLADRVGLEAACVPLWQEGTAFDIDKLEKLIVGKTLVFEGGHPSVYDPTSFTCKCCPRDFIYSVYKRVLLMRHLTGPGVFICLSHQLVIAALVELVKDAVKALLKSRDAITKGVAEEIHSRGTSIKIIKDGEDVVCEGYEYVDAQGCDQFATARNEQPEAELLKLYPFDADEFADRSDLKECLDAHSKIDVPEDEIKLQMKEDKDGFFLAMFHSDEVNAEAVLFANWALGQIAKVHRRHRTHPSWLKRMPHAVEITACTKDEETDEMVTEVASMRIDYEVDGSRKSFYTCQFHPELDRNLRDSRKLSPCEGEDGERLIHSLLLNTHIKPDEDGGYTPSPALRYNASPQP